jgi:hypothetical protein
LEDIEVVVADHVQRVMKPNFGASWDEVGEANELEDTYALSAMKTLEGLYDVSWYNLSHTCLKTTEDLSIEFRNKFYI